MGRDGMAGNYYRKAGYVTMRDLPDPNREYIETFNNLTGGMNTFDLPFNLKSNESPFMVNMNWRNGHLGSRRGQVKKWSTLGGVIAVAPMLFHGWLVLQAQETIRAIKIQQESSDDRPTGSSAILLASQTFPRNSGVFFRWGDDLFYKNYGAYVRVKWNSGQDQLNATLLADTDNGTALYKPVIQIHTDPLTGAGLEYQKENALSAYKWVYFDAASGVREYHLPVQEIDGVQMVLVDGNLVSSAEPNPGYSVNLETGVITFTTAPPVHTPPVGDTVQVLYRKSNENALRGLMEATAATAFGGAQELCVIFGGGRKQPNAYYWSGNNGTVMDPTYFPINQYNLAGDNNEPITAFGKQQNMLVIFQPNATGRAVFGTETINDLVQVTMNYTRINAEIGCDVPGSLQLVSNNLVWCNRKYGICRLKDSSAAYENNITVISQKVNNPLDSMGLSFGGLLAEFQPDLVGVVPQVYTGACSTDTGKRYILVVDGHAYEWNYELSDYNDPSWFFHTGIEGVGFVPLENEELYEVTEDGKVMYFDECYYDYADLATDHKNGIEKYFTFPPRNFGSYDRVKNIMSILLTTRADTAQNTQLYYLCDYKGRIDPKNLVVKPSNDDPGRTFAKVFRRKPGYHNIHHLQIGLWNETAEQDLSILSCQIFYTYRGRTR